MSTKSEISERYDGEWSGATVRATRKGWLVESWSRIQGSLDGRRVLVRYNERAPQGAALDLAWNEHMALGDALISGENCFPGRYIKVMRRGEVVQ